MANPQRGEVSFEASGRSWVLKMTTNAMCSIEEATGKSMAEVGTQLANPKTASITLLRAMFWGCLQNPANDRLTLEEVSELMDEIGLEQVGKLVGEASTLAHPAGKAGKKKKEEDGSRPTHPATVQ